MTERAVRFGPAGALSGIYHCPEKAADLALPGVIILPAGIDQKVGPTRLYVGIARAIAAAGFPVLRFDYFGLGESHPSPVTGGGRAGSLPSDRGGDVDFALDWLSRERPQAGVVLLGLCSGAHDAHRVAARDQRIVGVCQLDGYGYRTGRYWLQYTVERLFDRRRWVNVIRRKLPRKASVEDGDPVTGDVDFFTMPAKRALAAELRAMMSRDVRLLYLFSGQTSNYYNYERQFAAAFSDVDFGQRLTEAFFPEADHTFSRSVDRRKLTARVASWLTNEFRSAS